VKEGSIWYQDEKPKILLVTPSDEIHVADAAASQNRTGEWPFFSIYAMIFLQYYARHTRGVSALGPHSHVKLGTLVRDTTLHRIAYLVV
jgi:hypothetical protein